jgi:crotonobetainyl-CoA:carnitine CoA-transferase CaiB-like acyl-CoA transferase
VSSDHIRASLAAVGRPEWADEVLAHPDQLSLVRALFDKLETVTKTGTVDHWLAQFRIHDVPAAPCLTFDAHMADAQVVHNGLYSTDTTPDGTTVRGPRYPAVFASSAPLTGQGAAPSMGADTDAVRKRLGAE